MSRGVLLWVSRCALPLFSTLHSPCMPSCAVGIAYVLTTPLRPFSLHRDSIVDFSNSVHGTSSKDVMDLLVLNQYFDTLQQIGTHPGTRCVFLNGDTPEVTKGILQGNAAKN
jgi:hypothetical protein